MSNQKYQPEPRYFNVAHEPEIGENCSLVDVLLDCSAPIKIGNNVAFGHGCMLLTGKHDYTKFGKERMEVSISEPIIIEDGAWIASGAIICGGVTIGANAVVGANSVVMEDVPPYTVVAGSPAIVIKEISH